MGAEEVGEILLDQPLARMTPPEHDVLLDAPRDQRGRRRLARGAASRDFAGLVFTCFSSFAAIDASSHPPRHNPVAGQAKPPIAMIILKTIL